MTIENQLEENQIEQVEDFTDDEIDKYLETKGDIEKIRQEPQQKTEKKEVKQEQQQPQQEEKKVDLRALQEERARRKQFQKEATENKARLEEVNNLLKTIAPNLFQGQQQENKQNLSFDDDPIQYLKENFEQVNQTIQQLTKAQQERFEQEQVATQERQFLDNYKNHALQYAKEKPDFKDAYNYLMSKRLEELRAFGYDDNSAAQVVTQEERFLINQAFSNGINPAESLYKIAQLRGFGVAPTKQENPQVMQKVEAIKKGLELNKPVANGKIGGESLTDELESAIDEQDPFADINSETNLDKLIRQMRK